MKLPFEVPIDKPSELPTEKSSNYPNLMYLLLKNLSTIFYDSPGLILQQNI